MSESHTTHLLATRMSASQTTYVNARDLNATEIQALLAKLISELPYTIPLTRRLQFEHKFPSPTSRVWIAYRQADRANVYTNGESLAETKIAWLIPPHSTWLAAYIDLANPGQTQCWLFGSWELPDSRRNETVEQSLVNALFRHIFVDVVPLQPTEPNADWLSLRDSGKYLSQPFNRSKVLFGTIHDEVRKYLTRSAVKRIDESYGKYIFDLSLAESKKVSLPEGYEFGKMREDLLQTVLDRSPIPRTLKTLKSLLNVGLYYNGQPIGWGFIGKDGSLSSLHTESEHRGKGLAVAVGKELIRRQTELFGEEGSSFCHSDVSESNAASNSVMKKLGGKVMWRVAWVEIDLSEALEGQVELKGNESQQAGTRQ